MWVDPEEVPKSQSDMVAEEMDSSFNAHLTQEEQEAEPMAEESEAQE